jgi:hypothetical protein
MPGSSRAGFEVPPPALRIAAPHAIEIALLCGCAAAIMLVPPGALDGFLAAIISGGAILVSAAVTMVRERRSSASRFAEVASLTIACGALAAACAIDRAGRAPALVALAILAGDRAGRLLEIAGRCRSGVLDVVSGNGPPLLASEWRDNSSLAARIRTLATIVEWARVPLALGAGAAVWFTGFGAQTLGLYAGATVVLALSPRALRMVTGDAHLSVALRAARAGVVIRDAHTVHQVASARIVMFMTRRALVAPEVRIVDWQMAEGADEGTVKDALAALEAGAQGRFAAALREFLGDRPGAGTAIGVEERPGRGLAGDTRHGRVVCGTRTLLLELGISTAMHEAWARGVERSGRRAFFVAIDGVVRAMLGAQEEPAPGVQEVTRRLALLGLDPAMTTSAEADAAIALGARLGIENVRFETREADLDSVLSEIAASGDKVVIVGSGIAFEENLRTAAAAIAVGSERPSMAGVDARGRSLQVVADIIEDARCAARSVRLNLILTGVAAGIGLGLATGWHSPWIVLVAGAAAFGVCAFSMINGPFPALGRIAALAIRGKALLRRLLGERKSQGA